MIPGRPLAHPPLRAGGPPTYGLDEKVLSGFWKLG